MNTVPYNTSEKLLTPEEFNAFYQNCTDGRRINKITNPILKSAYKKMPVLLAANSGKLIAS